MDGITKEQYGQELEARLHDLHERLVARRYRHRPIRRVHIPKEGGKTRPIGISVFEDKLVQDAVREVLEAIYEQDFLPCSYGFRPDRSAHDAMRAIDGAVHQGRVNWILEADIVSFFDRVDRTALIEMLRGRIADESLLRLVGKCLHVGVLDESSSNRSKWHRLEVLLRNRAFIEDYTRSGCGARGQSGRVSSGHLLAPAIRERGRRRDVT